LLNIQQVLTLISPVFLFSPGNVPNQYLLLKR
jgi:hypothetical protein